MLKKRHVIKNKLLLKILIFSFIFIILGIFYVAILSKTNKLLVKESLNSFLTSLDKLNYMQAFIKCLTTNIVFTILIWIFGISIIGIPIIIIILILKSFILGFSISSLIYFYKLKGIILALIYIIPLLINLFIIVVLSYYGILFSKNLNKLLFLKKNINFMNVMKRYLKILLLAIIGISASSFIEIYIIPYLLNFFS